MDEDHCVNDGTGQGAALGGTGTSVTDQRGPRRQTTVRRPGPVTGDRRFRALVEHSSDLMVVLDAQGGVRYANPAALAMFGRSEHEALGVNALAFVHPDDAPRVRALYDQLLAAPDAVLHVTLRVVSRHGEIRVLEAVATNSLRDDELNGTVINGRDVTERDHTTAMLEASLDAVTSAIATAVELRDPFTAGHERRVAQVATAIAIELELDADDVKGIGVAGMLHDIGKIAVPSEILTRPGRLSTPEYEIVKQHCRAGHDIVAEVPFPWPVAEMILQHHERLDGSGYPQGLTGDGILRGSRVIAVADVVSAMSEHRPYRMAAGTDRALDHVSAERGRLFDGDAVDACLRLFRNRGFSLP